MRRDLPGRPTGRDYGDGDGYGGGDSDHVSSLKYLLRIFLFHLCSREEGF